MTPNGPGELDREDLLLGGALMLLLLQPHRWMHRRVENISFIDERSLERRVSVDLSVPGEDILGPALPRMPFLPLAFLDKEVLVGFDVRDENGGSLPALTKGQNGFAAWSVLVRIADADLRRAGVGEMGEGLRTELHMIATEQPGTALDVLAAIEQRAGRGSAVDETLMRSWSFMSFAYDLATRFLLLCPLDGAPEQRRVVKFSYVTLFDEPRDLGSRFERAASLMGWIPAEFNFEAPGVGDAASYHFEFTSPAELRVQASEAFVESVEGIFVKDAKVAGPRSHIYLGAEDPQTEGWVSVWLRPPRTGLTRAALVMTAVTSALMMFFLWDERIIDIEASEPIAILLSIPALVSTFIVRPGEHGLATNLLAGIRAAVGTAGLAAFSGAVLLIGGVAESTLLTGWKVLAIVSAVCFVSCALAFVGLPPLGRVGEPEFVTPLEENGDHGEEE